jgi:hypothetical protein
MHRQTQCGLSARNPRLPVLHIDVLRSQSGGYPRPADSLLTFTITGSLLSASKLFATKYRVLHRTLYTPQASYHGFAVGPPGLRASPGDDFG